MEDELEELLRYSYGRRQDMLTQRGENRVPIPTSMFASLKVVLPWLIAAGTFLWHAGGEWKTTAAANIRIDAFEQRLKNEFVTKDDFKHVAADVRDIKVLLMEGRRRETRP